MQLYKCFLMESHFENCKSVQLVLSDNENSGIMSKEENVESSEYTGYLWQPRIILGCRYHKLFRFRKGGAQYRGKSCEANSCLRRG